MLTAKENMREVIKCGSPDRIVNQYEAVNLMFDPFFMFHNPSPQKGEHNVVNAWGISNSFPANTPGSFPDHGEGKIVLTDLEHWQDQVKMPNLDDVTDKEWDIAKGIFDSADGSKAWKTLMVLPGLFEQSHHLMEITEALCAYMEEPELMHELIDYLTEWELKVAKVDCENLHPEAMFHHDDWGTEASTFMNPDLFREFFVKPYKKIYSYYKDHGCELIIHHSDSYAATLVDDMIEMGIDVWQGPMHSNNVPELREKYEGKITFMGNIDNKFVDFDGWTEEDCKKAARDGCAACGEEGARRSYIPCITQGGPGSVYPGTYIRISNEIERINEEKYGFTPEQQQEQRMEWQIMFGREDE